MSVDLNYKNPAIDEVADTLQKRQTKRFLQSLRSMLERQGPVNFTYDIAAPFLEKIGSNWANDKLSIDMEHIMAYKLSFLLKETTKAFSHIENDLRILLTTLPGERHSIGLSMAELLLRAEGIETINLGVETPVDLIVKICQESKPQVIIVSFNSIQKETSVTAQLRELDSKISEPVYLMAGGGGVCKLDLVPERIRIVKRLNDLGLEIRSIRRLLNKN